MEWPADAPRGASIVITATTSPTPVIPGAMIEPGAYTPATRELDTAAILRAKLVVDTRAGALHEAGDVAIPIQEGCLTGEGIWAEIGEIASGQRPGRTASDEIFVFKSVGNAMQDLVLGARIYERVKALGLGTEVTL